MSSDKHVSSILVNGSHRLIIKKTISAHCVDASRIPADCVWSLNRCAEPGGQAPVSLVRTVGAIDAVRELVATLSKSLPARGGLVAETFYSKNAAEEKARLCHEDICSTFPFSFKCACSYGGQGFAALMAVCLSFQPRMRAAFSNALSGLGLGDEVVRWVVAADERRIYHALKEKGVLSSVVATGRRAERARFRRFPHSEMSDAILKLCVHCDVSVDFLALENGEASAAKAPRLFTSSGERHILPDRYGGAKGDRGDAGDSGDSGDSGDAGEASSLVFVSRDDYRPDLSFDFKGRTMRLVAALVPHLHISLVHLGVHAGKGMWVEANRRLARCGVGPIHHTVLVRFEWWAEELLFAAETFAKGGRGRRKREPNPRSIVWIYAS